jgi:hypothetical protein
MTDYLSQKEDQNDNVFEKYDLKRVSDLIEE